MKSHKRLKKVNLVSHLVHANEDEDAKVIKRTKHPKELVSPMQILTLDDERKERRRELKKKWKTHSKISVQKLEPG
jgi:hypothetical protein